MLHELKRGVAMRRTSPTAEAKKLAMRRETLRSLTEQALSDDELRQVAGGAVPRQSRCCTSCPP